MSMRQLRAMSPFPHPPPVTDDFDEPPDEDETIRLVGYARGRRVGSDDQNHLVEVPDLLMDPME